MPDSIERAFRLRTDQNHAKPAKALLGIGLMLVVALALYGFNAVWSNAASPSSALQKTFHTVHLSPLGDRAAR